MQPTSEGVNSRTVCQPRVMMLVWPAQREDTSTMGPGSRYRRTWLTGKSRFSGCFGIGVLSRAPLCSDALGCSGSIRALASKYNLCSRMEMTSCHEASRMASTAMVWRRNWNPGAIGGNVLMMEGAEAEEVGQLIVSARQSRDADLGHLKPRMGR